MPVILDDNESNESDSGELMIGLVNNMPDSALEATERQFMSLLDASAGSLTVRLKFFALPEVPRGDLGWQRLRLLYADTSEIKHRQLDGLIVTGAEPCASDLRNEPYWADLIDLLSWVEASELPTIWSCLAAHAVVLRLAGIKRRKFREKCSGVFSCATVGTHRLIAGMQARFSVPHSRYNGLAEDDLVAAGFTVLSRSDEIGVDMFVRDGSVPFLFVQGHPEYSAYTLLREYRRDVRRYLTHEVEAYPPIPRGYFDARWEATFRRFREDAVSKRAEETFSRLWPDGAEAALNNPWRPAAVQLYANWLALLVRHKKTLAAGDLAFEPKHDQRDSGEPIRP